MRKRQFRALALLLSAILLLASCGSGEGGDASTTMRLRKTEGTVQVTDGKGAELDVQEDLPLYGGCNILTQRKGSAWIELDEGRLVKLDQETQAELQKDGGDLEIALAHGSLFFHITEPLEDGETLTIRTSAMAVGIRGTCGWVEVPEDGDLMQVYLLEGQLECTASGSREMILAGEAAALTKDGDITVEAFSADQIPGFVMEELEEDEDLAGTILDGAGLDISGGDAGTSAEDAGTPEETDPYAAALEQYRVIAGQAESYPYSDFDDSNGVYRYALAMMQTEYDMPALLLEQDTNFGISNVLVFQYDPAAGTVFQAGGVINEGAGSAGGYRGFLSAAGDGNGLLDTSWSSGTGMGGTSRVTLAGDTLQWKSLWEGNVMMDTDTASESIGEMPLDWHDVGDLSGLDSWSPSAPPAGVTAPAAPPEESEAPPVEAAPEETAPSAGGSRTVLTGTVGFYTYNEVLALQNTSDPNPGTHSDTFRLIVLDEPQTITARRGDGDGSREGEARIINVTNADGLAQYDGQHVTFSIDPDETWWPSDTSLPLGEPSTDDVHILK